MYAVIESGGKQYRVSEGDKISVEKLKAEINSKVEFEKVLLVGDGGDVKIGTPYLDAAKVTGTVLESGKGEKVIIFKYKPKKHTKKKQGHRQPYTMVEIDAIALETQGRAVEAQPEKKAPVKRAPAKKAEPEVVAEPEVMAEPVAEPVVETVAEPVAEPAVEKKPVARRTTAKKAETEVAEVKATAEPVKEKKPAAKRTTAKKAETEVAVAVEDKPVKEKKPAVKKTPVKKDTEKE